MTESHHQSARGAHVRRVHLNGPSKMQHYPSPSLPPSQPHPTKKRTYPLSSSSSYPSSTSKRPKINTTTISSSNPRGLGKCEIPIFLYENECMTHIRHLHPTSGSPRADYVAAVARGKAPIRRCLFHRGTALICDAPEISPLLAAWRVPGEKVECRRCGVLRRWEGKVNGFEEGNRGRFMAGRGRGGGGSGGIWGKEDADRGGGGGGGGGAGSGGEIGRSGGVSIETMTYHDFTSGLVNGTKKAMRSESDGMRPGFVTVWVAGLEFVSPVTAETGAVVVEDDGILEELDRRCREAYARMERLLEEEEVRSAMLRVERESMATATRIRGEFVFVRED